MSELETVHNYFERLVFNEIKDQYATGPLDDHQLADMACIALNHLPPKYIRYDIDMSFYMSGQEHYEVQEKVKKAVKKAYKKIKKLDNIDDTEKPHTES